MKIAIIIRQVKEKVTESWSQKRIWDQLPLPATWRYFWQSWFHQSSLKIQHFYSFFHEVFVKPKWDNQYKAIRKRQTQMSSYCSRGWLFLFLWPLWLEGAKRVSLAYRWCPCRAPPTTVGRWLYADIADPYRRPHPLASALTPLKVFNNKPDENTRICLSMYSLKVSWEQKTQKLTESGSNSLPRITRWNIFKINIKVQYLGSQN